jgi:hypothetical protein
MPVALGHDRDEELTGFGAPGVDARAVDGHVWADQLSAELDREFSSRESHASPSRPIV